MVLWHSCVNEKQEEKGMEERRRKAPGFFETYSLCECQHPWSSIAFQRNLPSRQIIPFPCPVLSFTHVSFVLDLKSCGKTVLLAGEACAAGREPPEHQSSRQ